MAEAISLLRHAVATLAYRGGKVVRGAPPDFSAFRADPGIRTPGEILAHVGDLFDWGVALIGGQHVWNQSEPLSWDEEVARFFTALDTFNKALQSAAPSDASLNKLFQGPVADAFTHIGQIALLRRMAGGPVAPENYFKARIQAGCVGADQPLPVMEFD